MALKPNYNFQKAERSRAKAQKKQEKLKRLQEETAKRKAAPGSEVDTNKGTDTEKSARAVPSPLSAAFDPMREV
jgi:hypothetical protein